MGDHVVTKGCLGNGHQRFDDSIFEEIPPDAGPRLVTRRGGVTHVVYPPGSISIPQSKHTLISVLLAPVPGMRIALGTERPMVIDAVPGTILVAPAGTAVASSWPCVRENITVILPTSTAEDLLAEETDRDASGLFNLPPGTTDRWALAIAEQMRAELAGPYPPNILFVDSLIAVLYVHLLRNTGGIRNASTSVNGGLSPQQAKLVIDYLEENFAGKVSVSELATIAGLSRDYFIRAFSRRFGKPPHRYLVDRRLDHAEKLILSGDLSIANIAYLSGFSSQSHMTATMRKYRNRTPMQLRRSR